MMLAVLMSAACGQGEDYAVPESEITPTNEVSAAAANPGDITGIPVEGGAFVFHTPLGTVRIYPDAICVVRNNTPVFGSAVVTSGAGYVITHPRVSDGLLQLQSPDYPGWPSETFSAYLTMMGRTSSGEFKLVLKQTAPTARCSEPEPARAVQNDPMSPG
ncbi:hypothetical protein [Myxococcus qinghaiensis]|uniref:hypothetical protein n=1 Tax=Myxococcus qinghaiensis TaxID=2906758 RepID=UPI0020A775C2|nr:hypothetical protein [Myxococcus qinghaiensis]MCP3165517.1 hypothetical protein [Myxococcus qinghaiensis]